MIRNDGVERPKWPVAALVAVVLGLAWVASAIAVAPPAAAPSPTAVPQPSRPPAASPVPMPSGPPKAGAPECRKDDDCTLIVDGCCDCAQGGKRVAVPTARRADQEAERQKRCRGTMCTALMSGDPSCRPEARAVCRTGACRLAGPSADGGTPAR